MHNINIAVLMIRYLYVRFPSGDSLVSEHPDEGGCETLPEEPLAWLTLDITSCRREEGRGGRRDGERGRGERGAERRKGGKEGGRRDSLWESFNIIAVEINFNADHPTRKIFQDVILSLWRKGYCACPALKNGHVAQRYGEWQASTWHVCFSSYAVT